MQKQTKEWLAKIWLGAASIFVVSLLGIAIQSSNEVAAALGITFGLIIFIALTLEALETLLP